MGRPVQLGVGQSLGTEGFSPFLEWIKTISLNPFPDCPCLSIIRASGLFPATGPIPNI